MSEHKVNTSTEEVMSNATVVSAKSRTFKHAKLVTLLALTLLLVVIIATSLLLWHSHQRNVATMAAVKASDAQQSGDISDLVQSTEQQVAADTDPQQKTDDYITEASYLLQQNNLNGAIAIYKQADKVSPGSVNVLSDLGNTYRLLKDKNNTILYYNQAISAIQADPSGQYASNLSYYQAVIANVEKGDFNPPKAGADDAHPNG